SHIVGHDCGGAIAWNMAQKFPQALDRLAILNAAHPHKYILELMGNLDRLRKNWHVLAFQVPGLPELLIQQNLKDFVKGLLQGQAIRKSAFSSEITQIYQAALEKPGALVAALKYYRNLLLPQNLFNWFQKPTPITTPTLILWGEEDALFSHQLTEDLDELIAAPFRLKLIPNCGHCLQQEVPQTVNRELLNFLRGR
ncbi:MAG: alpha/beta hydrolase, partial [Okeania sp. SIO2H7]|nr:alpha/beta hydrolase [Okeania sp. SIO2H7]